MLTRNNFAAEEVVGIAIAALELMAAVLTLRDEVKVVPVPEGYLLDVHVGGPELVEGRCG